MKYFDTFEKIHQNGGKKMAKDRFERIYQQGKINITEIWVDRETGVNYMFQKSGYSGGLTPLLDKEGKPVINPVTEK